MVYCTKCGTKNEEDAAWCFKCGAFLGSDPSSRRMHAETCELLYEGVKSSIESTDLFRQSDAKKKLKMLKKNKCRKELIRLHENYKTNSSPFVQQLAKKALEYAQSL